MVNDRVWTIDMDGGYWLPIYYIVSALNQDKVNKQ